MQPIRFPARGGFHETVKQRVEQYFADSRRFTTGDWRLFVKTGVILAWLAGSYTLLVFGSTSLLVTMLAVCALAQGCALVGFNIMHDGAHESYAHSKTINWLMGGMLNVIGGSQRLWRHKHNWLHHIYTNIDAIDNDLYTSIIPPSAPWWPRRATPLPCLCYPTVRAAIAGHYRFLKTMGRRPNVLSSPSSPGTTPTAAIITATQGRSWGMQ